MSALMMLDSPLLTEVPTWCPAFLATGPMVHLIRPCCDGDIAIGPELIRTPNNLQRTVALSVIQARIDMAARGKLKKDEYRRMSDEGRSTDRRRLESGKME
jgi:hypothetical protein